jgi:succinyl-diaminopimelate desuccinylase
LHGRGSNDSKAAIAVFRHLMARLAAAPDAYAGTVTLLCDLDEHADGFAGIRAYLNNTHEVPAGVMIGYPGTRKIVIGGRGFLRAHLTIYGRANHSAARHPTVMIATCVPLPASRR